MVEKDVPKRLWDYSLQWEAQVLSMIARGKDGIPGLEKILGERVDITEYLDFSFWDRVWFWDDPDEPPCIGRWLGVAHRVGSALCYYVIKSNGQIEARSTVQHMTYDDIAKPGIKKQVETFDEQLSERLKDDNFRINSNDTDKVDDIWEFGNENDNTGARAEFEEGSDEDPLPDLADHDNG